MLRPARLLHTRRQHVRPGAIPRSSGRWRPADLFARTHERRIARTMIEMVRRSLHAGANEEPVEPALLQLVLSETGVTGGAILRYTAGRFTTVASAGEVSSALRDRLEGGVPFGDPLIWRARREARPIYLSRPTADGPAAELLAEVGLGALALIPVARDALGEELVIALFRRRPHKWSARTRLLLDSVATVFLGVTIRLDSELRLSELVRLQRELLATPTDVMYRRALDAALRMVRTAEAGSLLVRGNDGDFRYVAAVGFDLPGLASLRFSLQDMRTWYGNDGEGWAAGTPRVLGSNRGRRVSDVSALTAPRTRMREAGRVDAIAADLCLPIIYQGHVLAVLNLDAMHDPNAFGSTATTATSDLAPVIGFLLHEAAARARLDEVARTDELTGLGNRRAFNEQAAKELARSGRNGRQLTLLVMDLSQFKNLNDRYGHRAGDNALKAVADVLRVSVRAGDMTFRWGGDEFAVLLPDAGLEAAEDVARRVEDGVSRLELAGAPLHVNAGGASVPTDGSDLDSLLTCADNRMYRAKARGRAWPDLAVTSAT